MQNSNQMFKILVISIYSETNNDIKLSNKEMIDDAKLSNEETLDDISSNNLIFEELIDKFDYMVHFVTSFSYFFFLRT